MDLQQKLNLCQERDIELNEAEIERLLAKDFHFKTLASAADAVRQRTKGSTVHIRGLVEISNICARDCFYCGIRRSNPFAQRYKLDKKYILDTVEEAAAAGFKTIVMQSGESEAFLTQDICDIIAHISVLGMAVTLSLGEKDFDTYRAFKDAGADRYLLRIETTDPQIYQALHPDMNLQNRINCLKNLKTLGFELGTGILVGLPKQTLKSIAKDILFFKDISADMIGLGPFLPCQNTPLAAEEGGTLELALRALAVTRLILPAANIPATTAMEALAADGRLQALSCGANVIMPNITGGNSNFYKLYPDKPINTQSINDTLRNLKLLLAANGRTGK